MPAPDFLRSRARSTYYTSLFSISLVLFFMGIFAIIAIGGKFLLDQAREKLELQLLLADDVRPERLETLETVLKAQPFVRSVRYLSKEQAGEEFIESTGDDFREALDNFNPFRASFNILLEKDYIHSDSIEMIRRKLMNPQVNPEFAELEYPITLIENVEKQMPLIINVAAVISILVLVIAYFLILSTVRLAVFSRRLVIRSMQLIGATNRFIRRPFLRIGITQGILGGLIAVALLAVFVWLLVRNFPEFSRFMFSIELITLYLGLIIFGALLGWFSSYRAVSRYLNRQLDDLV